MERIAQYTNRSETRICRDFDRWETRGLEGLADGAPPDNPPMITEEIWGFLVKKLDEEHAWNAGQLADTVDEEPPRALCADREPANVRDAPTTPNQ